MVPSARRTGLAGAAERLIRLWALLGGAVLLAIVAVNVFEVGTMLLRPLTGYRFAGGVEVTEMAAAVAAFCFLPWCQLTDANVTADIFTARASRRFVAACRFAASTVALGFALLLLWRMSEGMADQHGYGAVTTILSIPIWWAFVPILISLALLVLAAAITLAEAGRTALGAGDAR